MEKKAFFNEGKIYGDGKFVHDGRIYPGNESFFKDADTGKVQSILTNQKAHIGVAKE